MIIIKMSRKRNFFVIVFEDSNYLSFIYKIMREQKLQDIWFLLNVVKTQMHTQDTPEVKQTYFYLLDLKEKLQKQ